jgi:signal peptidase I
MFIVGENAVKAKKQQTEQRAAYEWVQALIGSVLAVVLLFTFVVRVVVVDGSSMRETLQDHDLILLLNDALCGEYEAQDIIVLSKETFENGSPIVKRVIATGGQTVEIDFNAGVISVDGVALEEPYTREPTWTPEGVEFPLTVPENHVFVLGDNRNHSSDSRHIDLGPIDERMVIGKAVFLAVPGKTAETDVREWSRIGLIE